MAKQEKPGPQPFRSGFMECSHGPVGAVLNRPRRPTLRTSVLSSPEPLLFSRITPKYV
jgi:hypothetical protein